MNNSYRWGVQGLWCFLSLIAGVTQAAAVINCGDTVTLQGATMVLDHDILACSANPVLTVVGPGTLDLHGHVLTCQGFLPGSEFQVGVQVTGSRAVVRNGEIRGCIPGIGVQIAGDHHLLTHMAVKNNYLGVFNNGRHNRFVANIAVGSQLGFIHGSTGARTLFINNVAIDNQVGFAIYGATATVRRNTASNNSESGVVVIAAGTGARVIQNLATANSVFGVDLQGSKNQVWNNTALGNGTADLHDATLGCDHNIWRHNIFDTSQVAEGPNPGCIQ